MSGSLLPLQQWLQQTVPGIWVPWNNVTGQAIEQIRAQQLRFCLCSAYDLSCSSLPMCCNIGTTRIDLWNLWILYGCIWGTWTGDKPQDRDDTSSPHGCWKMCLSDGKSASAYLCIYMYLPTALSLHHASEKIFKDDITGVLKGITLRAKRKQLRKMDLPNWLNWNGNWCCAMWISLTNLKKCFVCLL